MQSRHTTTNSIALVVCWIARITSLLSLGVLMLFLLGEFRPSAVRPREWVGVLFFPFGVMLGMLIGWWREGLGGAISIISLMAFYFIYGLIMYGNLWQGSAFIIFTLPGFLFLTAHTLKRMASPELFSASLK